MSKPAPFTPADADLRPMPYMPLHVAKLRDSDLAAECDPEACWYALLLWSAAWHQLPAGSLPNSDTVLCKLIGLGRDIKTFRAHKAQAMRGWVECSDGRLYHPVVAEVVNSSWEVRLEQAWRTECARIKKWNDRNGTDVPKPTLEDFIKTREPLPMSPGTTPIVPEDVPRDIAVCPEGRPQGHGPLSLGKSTPTEQNRTEGNIRDSLPTSESATPDLLQLTARIASAGGVSVIQPSKLTRAMDVVKGWVAAGIDVEKTILPVIAKRLHDMPESETVASLAYFDAPIRKAHAKAPKTSAPAKPVPDIDARDDGDPFVLDAIRRDLKARVGQRAYSGWLREGRAALVLNGESVEVRTGTPFNRDWITQHFLPAIREATKLAADIDEVRIK